MKSVKICSALLVFLFALVAEAAPLPSFGDLLSSGRIDEAIRLLNTRLSTSPNDAEANHYLSRAYFHLQKWDQAISYGERATSLAPGNAVYYLWLGRAYGEKADSSSFLSAAGLAKKIRANFEKAVELDPGNVDARSDLAEFYLEAPGFMGGGSDKAEEQARQIATTNPARGHWVEARVAEKKKDSAAAEREYNEAFRISGDPSYLLNLASYYRRQNRLNDMETTINKAVNIPSKKSNINYDAATLLQRAGRNLPGAADLLRRYLKGPLSEEAPAFQAHYRLGSILEKMGDNTGAANEYRIALSLASEFKPAREGLKQVAG
jgi:tetratricopeptide (TPR) repeat protein